MNLNGLRTVIEKSWSKDTSFDPDNWSEANPSLGQCAVTALIVNDHFDGEILWAEVIQEDGQKISHYFNKINEKEIDLTRHQFPEGTFVPSGTEKKKDFPNTRKFMLSDTNTKKRYELLKNKVIRSIKI